MNILQINNRFPDELSAVQYFEGVRWQGKIVCPYCSSKDKSKRNKDMRFHCKSCRKSYSVTTGTKLHNTRLPLKTWLYSFSIVTDAKKGVSALQLQRNIGVSYPTAHKMYMKIRGLMYEAPNKLQDVVEMDETFIGGKPRKFPNPNCLKPKQREKLNERVSELKKQGFQFKKGTRKVACAVDVKRGRGTKKIPVVGIVQRNGDVVAQVMRSLTAENLSEMVSKHVDLKDTVIVTDSYRGYNKLHQIIEHVKIDHQKMYSYNGVNTNTIESFWAVVERGIMGTYHQVSPKYLPKYVQEFVFKWNNRKKDDMFETLAENAMKPIS